MKIMDVRVKRVCKVSNKSREGLYWRDTMSGHQRRKLALEAGFDPDLVREMCRGGDFVYSPFLPEQQMKGAFRKACKKRAGKQTRKLGQSEVLDQLRQARLGAVLDQRDWELEEAERELALEFAHESAYEYAHDFVYEIEWQAHLDHSRAQLETA